MRTIRIVALAAIAASLPVVASARPSDINAQVFYEQAKLLETKGMAGVIDERLRPMMEQFEDAGRLARRANAEATDKGAPLYCVSDAERARGLTTPQALAILGAVPERQRRTSTLSAAWLSALKLRYPCR